MIVLPSGWLDKPKQCHRLFWSPNDLAPADASPWPSWPLQMVILRISFLIGFLMNLRGPQAGNWVAAESFLIQHPIICAPLRSPFTFCVVFGAHQSASPRGGVCTPCGVQPAASSGARMRSQPLGTGEGALTLGLGLASGAGDLILLPKAGGPCILWVGKRARLLKTHGI